MLKTHKFARKPFYVDAVRVSEANIAEVAVWAEGSVEKTDDGQTYVTVKVHRPLTERQTQAFIGDWVLFAGTGFKVYTPKAFDKTFEKVKTLTKAQADEAGIKVPHEPRPKLGAVGLAFKDAEAKKAPVPAPPKFRKPEMEGLTKVIDSAEIREVALVEKHVDPSIPPIEVVKTEGWDVDRINEAIEDAEKTGGVIEVVPGVELIVGDGGGSGGVSIPATSREELEQSIHDAVTKFEEKPVATPAFSEIAVSQPEDNTIAGHVMSCHTQRGNEDWVCSCPSKELSEEEKQANADAVIAEVLSDEA